MATASNQIAFDNRDFWIVNTGASQNETFSGTPISDTGVVQTGLLSFERTLVYPELTFTSNGLTYRYLGNWEVTVTRDLLGLVSTVEAHGSYGQILVESNGVQVAAFNGASVDVDFGSRTSLPLIDLVAGVLTGVVDALFGIGEVSPQAYENLHRDAHLGDTLPADMFAGNDTISGSTGDDVLNGFAGNDTLDGNGGNDILIGGSGSNTINGGAGTDTAVLSGNIQDFGISVFNGVITLTKAGDGTVTTLTNVENIQFDNGTLTTANDAPLAVNDVYAGTAVIESGVDANGNVIAGQANASGNVLTNDTDADTPLGDLIRVSGASAFGGSLTIVGSSAVQIVGVYGTLTISADGSYSYALDNSDVDTNALAPGATASEVFNYQVSDIAGVTATATLTIGVSGSNDVATGLPTITAALADQSILHLDTSTLSDPEGISSFANVQWFRDGVAIAGANSVDYMVTENDVGHSLSAAVQYTDGAGNVSSATSEPTSAIGGGADNIFGTSGDDILSGGALGDHLWGGAGADVHVGGDDAGIDIARYDDANYGNLTISLANPGSNTGVAAGDTYIGIEGIVGGAGDDTIEGDANANYLYGLNGNNEVHGGAGNDLVVGGSGVDQLFGDDGDDYVYGGGAGADRLDGGDGNDSLNGGIDADYLVGGSGNDGLFGGLGDDILIGDAGDDYIVSGNGNNSLYGGDGNDSLNGGDNADYMLGGGDDDGMFGGLGDDILIGDAGDDYIVSGNGNNSLYGGDGNDSLNGGDNADYIVGGAGNDGMFGGGGNDQFFSGAGADYMVGGAGADTYVFASGDGGDTITDFNVLEDRINLGSIAGLDTYADVKARISFNGVNSIVDLGGGDTITIMNVRPETLTADAFYI